MLENNNKKFIRQLSISCLKANKLRNIIAIFAIILTTVLFTTVATVLEGSMQSIQNQMIRQSGMRFMVNAMYITDETCEHLSANPAFSETGKAQYLGTVSKGEPSWPDADLMWADKSCLSGCFVEVTKGRLPENEDEVLMDAVAMKMLGIPEEAGQTAALSYEVNGDLRTRQVTVSGIYTGVYDENHTTVYVSRAFMDRELAGIRAPEDGIAGAGSFIFYGSFPSKSGLKDKLRAALTDAGIDPDAQEGADGYVYSYISNAYGGAATMDAGVAAGAVLMIIIIVFAGYLIISNVFRISVMKDMRMYGQLKTIGTSPKQLRRLLRRQADLLNLIGIPIGLILGYGLGIILLPVVMKVTLYQDVGQLRPKLWVFAAAAVFSLITVWISSNKPAKMMSRMSPIQALRYEGNENGHRQQARGRESKNRILQMAVSNIIDNRRKTFLVVVSLSLSIILFNSVLNFTDTFDEQAYVEGQSGADFIVSNASFGAGSESQRYVVGQTFLDAVSGRPDIERNGAVYFYQPEDAKGEAAGDNYDGISTVRIDSVNGAPYPEEQAMELGQMLFGFDAPLFERCQVVAGALDMEKLATGKYIVEATTYINDNKSYDENVFLLQPGDKVRGEIDGTVLEYEVLANVVVSSDLLSSSSYGEFVVMILPSEEYLRQFPGKLPIHYVMDVKEGQFEAVNKFLEDYENQPLANISYDSSQKVTEEFKAQKSTFTTTGLVLAVIFGVIGLLNLLNVTLTNAISRQREFAIMQSIGMTRRQLRKLFVIEGVMYSVIAGILSLLLSGLLSLTAVRALTGAYWFCIYHFTVLPAVALLPVYILFSGGIAVVIDRIWNDGSVVERLRLSK